MARSPTQLTIRVAPSRITRDAVTCWSARTKCDADRVAPSRITRDAVTCWSARTKCDADRVAPSRITRDAVTCWSARTKCDADPIGRIGMRGLGDAGRGAPPQRNQPELKSSFVAVRSRRAPRASRLDIATADRCATLG